MGNLKKSSCIGFALGSLIGSILCGIIFGDATQMIPGLVAFIVFTGLAVCINNG